MFFTLSSDTLMFCVFNIFEAPTAACRQNFEKTVCVASAKPDHMRVFVSSHKSQNAFHRSYGGWGVKFMFRQNYLSFFSVVTD